MSGENKPVFVGPFKERRPGQGSSAHRGACALSVWGSGAAPVLPGPWGLH